MSWQRVRQSLFPGEAERDEGFRQELLQQSHVGLQAVAAVTIAAALFLAIGRWIFFAQHAGTLVSVAVDGMVALVGVLILIASRSAGFYPYSRVVAIVVTQLMTVALICASLYLEVFDGAAAAFIPGQMTLGTLILAVALPLLPWQAFVHGLVITGSYIGAVYIASRTFLPGATVQTEYLLFMATLTVLVTGLSTIMYAQRRKAYLAYLQTLHAAEELRTVQQRLALSESASSMARLAAAISHELNTPIGAMKSAVDTLLLLAARQATAPPEQQARLIKLQADLRKSIQESATRLQQIGARVARFTNLDQAELQSVCVNTLLTDVAELLRPRLRTGNELKLDLAPLSEIAANPQRLSSVFYDLINNSVNALNGKGRVEVRTRQKQEGIEVSISDNGRGIEKDRLHNIFEPGFHETAGRMASGNWSMFNARQIVREQGGEIGIDSQLGAGTTVTISLPFGRLT